MSFQTEHPILSWISVVLVSMSAGGFLGVTIIQIIRAIPK
jgi:hypothetical protein